MSLAIRLAALCLTGFSAGMAGCAATPPAASASYVVQPQDTLYSIAWRHNLDYRDLARWNHIGPDFRIAVGQRLTLRPGGAISAAAPAPAPAPALPRPTEPQPAQPNVASHAAVKAVHWVWPTTPRATRPADTPRRRPNGGVFFPGRLGQDVCAAASGRVVYTGSGIRGYGQLVIIKHSDVVLSAYAFNREVLVTEGQEVAAGQTIAHMGSASAAGASVHAAAPEAVLYFEIRLNGRPVDPLPYLSMPES